MLVFQVSLHHMHVSIQSLVSPQMLCITAALISSALFFLPSDLWHTLRGSSPLLLRDLCAHREECVSFLTLQRSLSTNKRSRRGTGGREEDVKMLGSWEEGKKKRALCGCLSDRIWSNSMALAFGKIASFNGHSLQEASPDMRPHMSERLRERERESISGREKTAGGCFRSSVFC